MRRIRGVDRYVFWRLTVLILTVILEREKEFFQENFGNPKKVIKNRRKKRGEVKVKKPPVGKAVTKPKTVCDFIVIAFNTLNRYPQAKGKKTTRKPILGDSDYRDTVCYDYLLRRDLLRIEG